jgi:hypothetical protein
MFRISEKLKSFEGIDDQFFSKVVDDLSSRAKKLEDDLLRYETRFAMNELILTLGNNGIAILCYEDVANPVSSL